MARCYIALGSNLEQPLAQVAAAVTAIGQLPRSTIAALSPWYRSPAVGPGDQPDYINGVLALETDLGAEQLLDALQAIEQQQGRIRGERWAARTLDLDILLYGDQSIQLPRLTVPHARMLERQFVLQPLLALVPDISLPDGTPVAGYAARLDDQGVCLVGDSSFSTMTESCATAAGAGPGTGAARE